MSSLSHWIKVVKKVVSSGIATAVMGIVQSCIHKMTICKLFVKKSFAK